MSISGQEIIPFGRLQPITGKRSEKERVSFQARPAIWCTSNICNLPQFSGLGRNRVPFSGAHTVVRISALPLTSNFRPLSSDFNQICLSSRVIASAAAAAAADSGIRPVVPSFSTWTNFLLLRLLPPLPLLGLCISTHVRPSGGTNFIHWFTKHLFALHSLLTPIYLSQFRTNLIF
jgi:hypothetical protein